MSEEHVGVPVLERAPDGADGPLDALFFVVIALFLGKHHTKGCALQCRRHAMHAIMYAGVFTKHVLAWTKIPFTALLLVSSTGLRRPARSPSKTNAQHQRRCGEFCWGLAARHTPNTGDL